MDFQELRVCNKRQGAENEDEDTPNKKANMASICDKEDDMVMNLGESNTETSEDDKGTNNSSDDALFKLLSKIEKHLMSETNDTKKSIEAISTDVRIIGQQLKDQSIEINELKEKLEQIHAEVALSKVSYIHHFYLPHLWTDQ